MRLTGLDETLVVLYEHTFVRELDLVARQMLPDSSLLPLHSSADTTIPLLL